MSGSLLLGLGLLSLSVGVGAIGYGLASMLEAWPKRNAIAAKGWDKLSTRAILKSMDPDLKTYFLKEQEYLSIVHEFEMLKESTIKTGNYTAMSLVMHRLRQSPFFNEDYRPEYAALWLILTQSDSKDGMGCSQLFEAYPDFRSKFRTAYTGCRSAEKRVSVREAIEALERKLRY